MKKLKNIDGACAPFALKYLSKVTDVQILESCIANGMEEHQWRQSAKRLGIRLRRLQLKKRGLYRAKLGAVIEAYPVGAYVVYTAGHLFVLDNGVVVDPLNEYAPGLDRLVLGLWKVLD